jgi:general secretion pathway protein G
MVKDNKHYLHFGFTLLELLLVLTILTLLAGLAAPVVSKAIINSKEAALRENLQVMRHALDDYYADKGHYPDSAEILVEEKYLRFIPEDPVYGQVDWDWQYDDDGETDGVIDIKSYSQQQSLSGALYNEW